MKASAVIFSLFLIGNIKGDILADNWKEGAADIGPIDLEPNLNGTDLFLSLTKDIGTFMEEYEKVIDSQYFSRISFYGDGSYYRSVNMREAVSRANDSTPANAFDAFMIQDSNFIQQFIDETKDYLGGNTPSFRKFDSRRTKMQPHLLRRGISDFLLHLDDILITDFSVLSSYIEEMISMGRQRIFQHYNELITKYTSPFMGILSMMKGYLMNAESYREKLQLHTSPAVFFNFDNLKNEALKMIPENKY